MTKTIVVPGEIVSDKLEQGNGIYANDKNTVSKYVGVLYSENDLQVVPLNGRYIPKEGDQIIGLVKQVDVNGYILDIKSFRYPYVHKRSIKTELKPGEFVLCQVYSVNEVKEISLDIQAKLEDGFVLEISPKKVPRVIGKHKSMISMLEKYSGCKMLVGANGYIFCQDGKQDVLQNALEVISKYSHVDNLTEKMDTYLQKMK